jgi:hypothetical protein
VTAIKLPLYSHSNEGSTGFNDIKNDDVFMKLSLLTLRIVIATVRLLHIHLLLTITNVLRLQICSSVLVYLPVCCFINPLST